MPAAASADAPRERFCGSLNGFPGIVAGKHTSCQFARATGKTWVANGWDRPAKVRVYSTATKRTYTMRCRMHTTAGPGDMTYGLCTGGKNARVKLTS